jgi:hypothetical protein
MLAITILCIIVSLGCLIGFIILLNKKLDIQPSQDKIIIPEQSEDEGSLESYYNNKWPKSDITYYGRVLKGDKNTGQSPTWNYEQIPVDVKAFILDNDSVMKYVLKTYNLIKETYDETMLAIQDFVCNKTMESFYAGGNYKIAKFNSDNYKKTRFVLTYTSDSYYDEATQTSEFWKFPFETIQAGKGDCEDGAILIASLAINAGIPAYRVKVASGFVSNRQYLEDGGFNVESNLSEGGHAYCIYLASDNEWRCMDWCFYADPGTPILQKPLAKNGGFGNCYGDVWFTFNNKYSWNQTNLDIVGQIAKVSNKTDLLKE